MGELNYWWVPRPKRKLNSIPEVLAAFANVALTVKWDGSRDVHIMLEEELERTKTKRVGERRDNSGSGGRTYKAWLSSLGLVFTQESTGVPYLTLAGEAIMEGKSPVVVLREQVLKYQFPSYFSVHTKVSRRFRIHPFLFLLRIMLDSRITHLSQEEIAKVVITEATDESDQCFEYVVSRILAFRDNGDQSLPKGFVEAHASSKGTINSAHPYSHLIDTANTIMNWLEYTQLIIREDKRMTIRPECRNEIKQILRRKAEFIPRPENQEFFQRRYGVDPWHQKDTRNLLKTVAISSKVIDMQRIRQAFISYSLKRPIASITPDIIAEIANNTGTNNLLVEQVLYQEYPHGAIGGYLSSYYEMAFKGRDEAAAFEVATASIFRDILGFNAIHVGRKGSKSTPDVLLISDDDGYQAIIDNKAYSCYSISGDHHNRMVHNYIGKISSYSQSEYPIGFFTYIAGGFANTIDKQIQDEVTECGVHGSCITVGNIIKLVELHQQHPYTHKELRDMFGLNRQVMMEDLIR